MAKKRCKLFYGRDGQQDAVWRNLLQVVKKSLYLPNYFFAVYFKVRVIGSQFTGGAGEGMWWLRTDVKEFFRGKDPIGTSSVIYI